MEPKGAKWIGLAAALGGAIRERKVTARGHEFRFFFSFLLDKEKKLALLERRGCLSLRLFVNYD